MRDAAAPVAALLELLRARRKGDVSGLALRGETDWQRLVEAASVHGVAPLLHRQLGSLGVGDRVPRAARMGLEDAYHCNRLRNAVLWELLAEILTAFRRAGLGCIVLKGPHLAEAIYGDAGLRPIRDFDLLVRREEETAARDVLRRSGWHQRSAGHDDASHHHAAPFRRPGLLPVELHRRLGRGFDEETTDGMWKRSETRDFGGAPAGVLAPADLLLHLCVHATLGHRLRIPILSLVDVASLVRRRGTDVDWGSLASTANRAGVGRYVYTTLRVAESTLAAGIPPHVADALRHTEQDETMVDVIRH